MIRVYEYWRSSAAYRLRIGLHLKGVAYDSVPVNILTGRDEQFGEAYKSKNPQSRVPALETEQGILTQSLALLDWLEETHPAPSFYVGDAWMRAQIRAFALTIACDIHPIDNLAVLNRLRSQFAADDAAIASWYVHWIAQGFAALEAQLAKRPESAFAFGDTPTLADICLVPQVANSQRYKMDLSLYPRLKAIDERARAHPAFIAAAPENQKDAVKA
ncbi:MAG TPA: maleylacetoacetate isomerase [Caulobacterales bacterium]|nr:maleylacetoacetate isomerase [Caulobacterales bacterium]